MKMIDILNGDSLRTIAIIKLTASVVPPRADDVADLLAMYRNDITAEEAWMTDEEYRGILGIN